MMISATGSTLSLSNPVEIMLLLGGIALLPAVLMVMTPFTRILIVLGFMRNALGTTTSPPTQILVGIALFLSLFIMAPTLRKIDNIAVKPYQAHTINGHQAIERGLQPLRTFMFNQTRTSDLELFIDLWHGKRPQTRAEVPTHVLVPAFIVSELTTAFEIGFLIYLPFLIIDMIVSATLMSMGMMMLPPVLISLPFKILLFVLVDGWHLVIQSLVTSYH